MSSLPTDVVVRYEGKVSQIEALTQPAFAWLTEHMPADAARSGQMWLVEEATLQQLVREMEGAGLTVELYQQAPVY